MLICRNDSRINTFPLIDDFSTISVIEKGLAKELRIYGPLSFLWMDGSVYTEENSQTIIDSYWRNRRRVNSEHCQNFVRITTANKVNECTRNEELVAASTAYSQRSFQTMVCLSGDLAF